MLTKIYLKTWLCFAICVCMWNYLPFELHLTMFIIYHLSKLSERWILPEGIETAKKNHTYCKWQKRIHMSHVWIDVFCHFKFCIIEKVTTYWRGFWWLLHFQTWCVVMICIFCIQSRTKKQIMLYWFNLGSIYHKVQKVSNSSLICISDGQRCSENVWALHFKSGQI